METRKEKEKKERRQTSCKITNFISPMIHRASNSNVPENPRFSLPTVAETSARWRVTRANKLKRYEPPFFYSHWCRNRSLEARSENRNRSNFTEKIRGFFFRLCDSFQRTRNVAERGSFRNEACLLVKLLNRGKNDTVGVEIFVYLMRNCTLNFSTSWKKLWRLNSDSLQRGDFDLHFITNDSHKSIWICEFFERRDIFIYLVEREILLKEANSVIWKSRGFKTSPDCCRLSSTIFNVECNNVSNLNY